METDRPVPGCSGYGSCPFHVVALHGWPFYTFRAQLGAQQPLPRLLCRSIFELYFTELNKSPHLNTTVCNSFLECHCTGYVETDRPALAAAVRSCAFAQRGATCVVPPPR